MDTLKIDEKTLYEFETPGRARNPRGAQFRIVTVAIHGVEIPAETVGGTDLEASAPSWMTFRLDVMDPPGCWCVVDHFTNLRACYLAANAWEPAPAPPPPVRGLSWHVVRAVSRAVRDWMGT